MVTTAVTPADPEVRRMGARFAYQLKQFGKGEATAKQRIPDIVREANEKHFPLPSLKSLGIEETEELAALVDGANFSDDVPTGDGKTAKSAEKNERETSRKAKVARAKEERAATKAAKPKREKVVREPGPCLDGCGATVNRPTKFVPGHDAKLKSLILKIERGDEPMESLPEVARPLTKFKKGEVRVEEHTEGKGDDKKVTKTKVQEYICTEAPVKLPAR